MLPINFMNPHTGEIIHIDPEVNSQEWRRAIMHEFSAKELYNMRTYPNNFHYMLDALRRSVNCKPGNHFILFERNTQEFRQDVVYEIVSCTEDRLVFKPYEGGDEITFEGDALHNHMMFFVKCEGKAEE